MQIAAKENGKPRRTVKLQENQHLEKLIKTVLLQLHKLEEVLMFKAELPNLFEVKKFEPFKDKPLKDKLLKWLKAKPIEFIRKISEVTKVEPRLQEEAGPLENQHVENVSVHEIVAWEKETRKTANVITATEHHIRTPEDDSIETQEGGHTKAKEGRSQSKTPKAELGGAAQIRYLHSSRPHEKTTPKRSHTRRRTPRRMAKRPVRTPAARTPTWDSPTRRL